MTTAANKATLWKLGKLSFSLSFQGRVERGRRVGGAKGKALVLAKLRGGKKDGIKDMGCGRKR